MTITSAPLTISYCSDIHTEFGALDKPLPGGDILLLAGDILVIRAWNGEKPFRDIKKRGEEFIEDCVAKYKRVFMCMGNHEPYNSDFDKAQEIIQPWLAKKGVTLLEKDHIELRQNVLLFGATLWTDFNKDDTQAMRAAQYGMNDFKIVKHLTPQRAYDEHIATLEALDKLCNDNPEKTIVVMSHHAPSFEGINPDHSGSRLDPAYASNLWDWIKAHPNIKHWVHGHTHIQKQYKIAQAQVYANCRGYIGYEHTADTFKIREFTVDV